MEALISANLSSPLANNCKIITSPSFQKINYNEYRIGFSIERENSSKDLIVGKQQNEGVISCIIENGKINARIDYTSRETYNYATTMFRKIEDDLLNNGFIENKFSLIKFNMFTNTSRINFFLSFLNMNGVHYFDDPVLEYIKVKPDHLSEEELPFDLESLKEKVKDLAINGKALDTIHYFKDEYKPYLFMQRVRVKYKYDTGLEKGSCMADMDFKNAFNNNDFNAELNCNIEILRSRANRGKSTESIKKNLRVHPKLSHLSCLFQIGMLKVCFN